MGAFVASTIWPILFGLYWRKANATGASLAMLLGTGLGLWAYFSIGFYVAALVSTAVSLVVITTFSYWQPDQFNWQNLQGVQS